MPPDAAPASVAPSPVALAPRWLRPLLLASLVTLLLASLAVSTANRLNLLCWPGSPTTGPHLPPLMRESSSSWWWPTNASRSSWQTDDSPPRTSWQYQHAVAAPGNWWGTLGNGLFTLRLYLPRVFTRDPVVAILAGMCLAHLYLLVPVMLLCALFCARLGVERGQALETGALPGLLLFAALMFATGMVSGLPPAWPIFVRSSPDGGFFVLERLRGLSPFLHVGAPTSGLLLLACFAVARADPPARGGFGWTLVAGALGALCVYGEVGALGSVGAVGLYAWWSGGWRRAMSFALGATVTGGVARGWKAWGSHAWIAGDDFHTKGWVNQRSFAVLMDRQSIPLYAATFLAAALLAYRLRRWMPVSLPAGPGPEAPLPASPAVLSVPLPLPVPDARRVIGLLLLVAGMGTPAAITSAMKQGGVIDGWEFIILPASVAAALWLAIGLERARRSMWVIASAVLGVMVFGMLLWSGLTCRSLYPPALQSIRGIVYPDRTKPDIYVLPRRLPHR